MYFYVFWCEFIDFVISFSRYCVTPVTSLSLPCLRFMKGVTGVTQ